MAHVLAAVFATMLVTSVVAEDAMTDGPAAEFRAASKFRRSLLDGRYNELESSAADLRTNKTAFDHGNWKLAAFYLGVATPNDWSDAKEWEQQIEKLKEWKKAHPNSITATVALADSLMKFGKQARGYGFANEVSEEGGKSFVKRVNEASTLLKEARDIEEDCPQFHETLLTIGLYQGWPRRKFDAAFAAAIEEWPTYWGIYSIKAWYLLPRYFGRPGEVFEYADSTFEAMPKENGAAAYALIGIELYPFEHEGFFSKGKYSWQQMKEGFQALDRQFPDSNYNRNQFAVNALRAEDWETAAALLTEITAPEMSVWQDRPTFNHYRRWAEGAAKKKNSDKTN